MVTRDRDQACDPPERLTLSQRRRANFCYLHHRRAGVDVNSPVTMSLFDQGISGAMMTSIAVSPSMAKMTATASVESD